MENENKTIGELQHKLRLADDLNAMLREAYDLLHDEFNVLRNQFEKLKTEDMERTAELESLVSENKKAVDEFAQLRQEYENYKIHWNNELDELRNRVAAKLNNSDVNEAK